MTPDTHTASPEYATKADLHTEIRELRADIKADLRELRQEWRADMTELRADVRGEIRGIRTEIGHLHRVIITTLIAVTAIFGTIVAMLKLFA